MNEQITYRVEFTVNYRAGGTYLGELTADTLPKLADKVTHLGVQQADQATSIDFSPVTECIQRTPIAFFRAMQFNHAQKPVKRPRR